MVPLVLDKVRLELRLDKRWFGLLELGGVRDKRRWERWASSCCDGGGGGEDDDLGEIHCDGCDDNNVDCMS